jgi:pimeloyl-ACP methyl ester carboxylesterase
VSRSAYVEDTAAAIEQLGLAPVVLIGQSLGGHTAFLAAARYPELVRAVVVAEASAGGPDTDATGQVREALAGWPVPVPSLAAARAFFGGETLAARVWTEGLERREEGWWPRFDLDRMVASLSEGAERSYWEEWAQVRCPTLIVRAERGLVPADEAQAMHERLPRSELVTLPGASHDLHLDRPDEWSAALARFLARA